MTGSRQIVHPVGTMNRREMLQALAAVPLAARQGSGAETELVVCGWDEVFILALGAGATPAHRKVWS